NPPLPNPAFIISAFVHFLPKPFSKWLRFLKVGVVMVDKGKGLPFYPPFFSIVRRRHTGLLTTTAMAISVGDVIIRGVHRNLSFRGLCRQMFTHLSGVLFTSIIAHLSRLGV